MTDHPEGFGLADVSIGRDVADRLAAAKLWLVSTSSPTTCGNLPYLATAVYALIPVATPRVASMSVDRYWRAYVNTDWALVADIPVIAGRMAHLVWHLLAEHADRGADLDVRSSTASQWEQAADATIAELLPGLDEGLKDPSALGLPAGRSAEEYFARLSRLPVTPHIEEREANDPQRADPEDRGDPDDSCGSGCDGQHRAHELPPGDGAGVGSVGRADADDIRRRVAIEFREHQARIGSAPGEWDRWVAHVLDPVVPWQQVLASAVRRGIGWAHGHADYTYTRISRRQAVAGPVILPATRRPVPEVAVVVDTSGSVDDGLLAQALGEVDGVMTGMGVSDRSVTVLATDAAVHHVTRVRSAVDAGIGGGGGTNMGAGIEAALALKPRPTLIVVITDGYTPWPALPVPTPVVAVVIGRVRAELPATPGWLQRVECVPP